MNPPWGCRTLCESDVESLAQSALFVGKPAFSHPMQGTEQVWGDGTQDNKAGLVGYLLVTVAG